MNDIETQEALMMLSRQATPLKAMKFYEKNHEILKDWCYLYACDDDRGSFKLNNHIINGMTGIKSVFKGKSLWVIDSNMVGHENQVKYIAGQGIYFDSNAASYIYSLAYKEEHKDKLKNQLKMIQSLKIDYGNINPYLYLYEAQRHYESKPETVEYSRKTFAAMNALNKIDGPLDEEWTAIYQKYFREQCENEINPLFDKFLHELQNGLSEGIAFQANLIELLLLETKILEISSSKGSKNKLEKLIQFMDEEIETFMVRELAVCSDILFNDGLSRLTQKLNSLNNKKDPLKLVNNCAWDVYIFRIMDSLSNTFTEPKANFYISQLVSCDRDIWGIAELSTLKGIALHTKSNIHFPFMTNDPNEWLTQKLGEKRLNNISHHLDYQAKNRRLAWLESDDLDEVHKQKKEKIDNLLHEKRKQLLTLLKSSK